MALTRSMLKAMGIEDEKSDQIIEAHTETVDALKNQRDEAKEQAAKVPGLEKEIETLKAAQPTDDWEAKYKELLKEFEGYKTQVSEEEAKREKAKLYRAMLREAGVDEKRIEPIMKVTDLADIVVEDGAIKDAETVQQSIADEWGGFIAKTSTQGASVEEPPSNVGAKMSREDIMEIKDTQERQRAIAENIDQFQ